MQPQQRNLILFFLIVSLVLFLYIPLRSRFFPTPAPGDPEVAKKSEEKKKKDLTAIEPRPGPPVTPDNKLLTLGASQVHTRFVLRALLDPRGAGIRQVTVNTFRHADSDGRPTSETVLDLVPAEANRHEPSHVLNHFSPNDVNWDDRPLDTLARREWKVVGKPGQEVVTDETDAGKVRQRVAFQTEIEGVLLTKTYSLIEGEYHIGLQVDLERLSGGSKEPIKFRYQLTGAKGLPVEGKYYTSTYRNALVAIEDDRGYIDRKFQELSQIARWGGGNAIDNRAEKIIRYAGVATQYFASMIVVDDRQDNQKFLRRATPSLETAVARCKARYDGGYDDRQEWIGITSDDGKLEHLIYLPPGELRGKLATIKKGQQIAVLYRPLSYDTRLNECPKVAIDVRVGDEAWATHSLWEDDITVRVATEPVALTPGSKVSHRYLLYNGPVKPSLLNQLRGERDVDDALIDRYVNKLKLNTMTDYQSPGWMGSFSSSIGWTWLLIKFTNLMHVVLGWLHLFIPSYGLSIIFLTLLVRALMFPLSRKQAAMSLKMQALQPELRKLAEKYKDNRQDYAQAQMELFRKHKVNPIGSCWVVLLQMPIFMGLYFALQESIQFRLGSFWPTWITNLAAPDMLLYWGRSIPLISRDTDFGGFLYLGPYLNILPIIAVALMVVHQKLVMPPPATKEEEMQQKIMRYMMIFMGIFFYKIAAGLCIYIITSTLWGFAERKMLPKAKPVGIDTDLDKRVAQMIETAKSADTGTDGASATQTKKSGRGKRRAERERTQKQQQPKTGLGGLSQRLLDWWNDVLEQARKKN